MSDENDNDEEQNFDYEVGFVGEPLWKLPKSAVEPPLWLITFTDIMALMLTFFVLMYSMSVPDSEKWEQIKTGLDEGLQSDNTPLWTPGSRDVIDIERVDYRSALSLNYLEALFKQKIAGSERLQGITVSKYDDRIVLSLPNDVLFNSGSVDVNERGKRALFILGEILNRIRNGIQIIGHADPEQITNTSGRFRSNWELSLTRALNTASVLRDVGFSRDFYVRGQSSAGFDELPETLPEEQRMALSRRVDIVILKGSGKIRNAIETVF